MAQKNKLYTSLFCAFSQVPPGRAEWGGAGGRGMVYWKQTHGRADRHGRAAGGAAARRAGGICGKALALYRAGLALAIRNRRRSRTSARTREAHWDATHNVYAYRIAASGAMRYSDDGEPQGTSGLPTLEVFRKAGVTNLCCIVTRYFGGVLLGAGGLVRALFAHGRPRARGGRPGGAAPD